jgi:tetratricopeptide (TPR) repeat protein
MKPRKFIVDLCCAVLCILAALPAVAQSDAQFAAGNQAYSAGNFNEAISDYQALVHAGEWSANLFYDLGNAYFRAGDFGNAILNYERALALDRHHPETKANLTLVRNEARALELQPGLPERYLRFASANEYAIAAAVAFWFGLFWVTRLIFAQRRSNTAMAMSILALLIFVGAILAAYWIDNGSRGRALGIVIANGVQARLATADTANSVLALPPGSEIKILSRRGDWIYAALPNNLRGWVPAKSAELVRL